MSVAVITGARVTNIFGLAVRLPLKLGIAGAAVASGLGQVFSLLILLLHFVRRKGVAALASLSSPLFSSEEIFKQGPASDIPVRYAGNDSVDESYVADQAAGGSGGIRLRRAGLPDLPFPWASFFGVSEGLQPLIGQSYGKKGSDRPPDGIFQGRAADQSGGQRAGIRSLPPPLGQADPAPCSIRSPAGENRHGCPAKKFGWAFIIISLRALIISAYLYSTKRTLLGHHRRHMRCLVPEHP